MNNHQLINPEFQEQVKQFKADWAKKTLDISKEKTPQYDGNGREVIGKKNNYDYIEESFMRAKLDEHFPGWSMEMAAPIQIIGSRWILAQVTLIIPDEHLIAYGINPPVRKFYGTDSVRIQYQKDQPKTEDTIIDIGDNAKQAVTSALKFAINRLTRIGDDIYGKRTELEGGGSLEEVMIANNDTSMFSDYLKTKGILPSKAMQKLGIKSFTEITDVEDAVKRLKNG